MFFKLYLAQDHHRKLIPLRMLLQENGAATMVQEGNILDLPQCLFHLPLHDDEKGEEKGDKDKKVEEEDKE